MGIDLSTLNPPQREAVLFANGPLVVFAGAGSGKTRVITHRIAHLIGEHGVPPWRILAVTFTNKAAAEMRERLGHLIPGGGARDLAVGTFHSICARLLRRHHERIGLPRDFTIYDDSDQKAMVTRVLRDLQYDDKRFPPKTIAGYVERAKQEMHEPSEIDVGFETPHVRKIVEEYERRMKKSKALDFGDLIYVMTRALEKDEAFRLELAGRFQYVLVDEFQDTNHSQLRLVLALAGVHRNLCVVGDDDQSIYRWRGADRRNILDFRRHYPDAHVVKLEQNYRSTKRILRAAHAVIERAFDREPKQLWTDNEDGQKIDVVRCPTERDEAELVVRTARELQRSGRGLSSLVVFYRVHAQSRVLEEGLRAASLPYKVVGGVRFYDRAEVKDLLAYLRVIQSPEDDVSVLRIINTPTRGIGKTSIEKLLDTAAASGTGVWEACKAAGGKIGAFVALIESLHSRANELGLAALAQTVLDETGYATMLKNENNAEADARIENLAELIGSMEQFVAEAEEPTLSAFLERVTLQTDEQAEKSGETITLMTVHAAKGLEFPVVICAGMEEQLFPFRGLEPGADPEELEEERRLAYVAFTRARQQLILSWATTRYVFGNLRTGTRSRFVDELPPDDVRQVGTSAPSYGGRASSPWTEDRGGSRLERSDGFRGRSLSISPQTKSAASGASTYVDRNDEGMPVRMGQQVRHVRYGVGKVVGFGGGSPPNIEVEFPGYGKKKIRSDFLEPM